MLTLETVGNIDWLIDWLITLILTDYLTPTIIIYRTRAISERFRI